MPTSRSRLVSILSASILGITAVIAPAAPGSVRAASALTAFYVDGGPLRAQDRAVYVTEAAASPWVAFYDSAHGLASIQVNTANDPNRSFHLEFAARPGDQLAVGTYANAVRYPLNGAGQPGFSIGKAGQGCNAESGEFTVSDIETAGSTLVSFAVAFVHQCDNQETSRGELRYDSEIGLKALVPYVGTLDLGDGVTGRATATKAFTIAARGNESSTVLDVAMAGAGGSEFEITSDACTGTTLAPGATCDIKIKMTAAGLGARAAQFAFAGDTFAGEQRAAIVGTGRPYAVAPASLDFGEVPRNLVATRSVTILNGLVPVSVNPAAVTDGFAFKLPTPAACANVAALGSCKVVVQFRPDSVGDVSGTLQAQIEGQGFSQMEQIPMTGTGVETSKVAWGTDRTAGRDRTWSYGKGLGRTVSGTTTYLHAIQTTDFIGGKWATDTTPRVGVYYVRTSNAGATWTTSLRLNPGTQHAERAAMTATGSNVYAAWVSQTKWIKYDPKAPRVLYVRANTNHGSTTAWKTAVRVSSATGRIDYPAIAASGNSVYVTYTDANTGNVRLATSRNRGATWTYRTLGVGGYATQGVGSYATADTATNGRAAYPAIAVSGSRVIVAWTSNADFKVVGKTSLDGGATWSAQATIANAAESEASVAATADRFVVAWTTPTGAQVRTHKAGAWGSIKSIAPAAGYLAHWTPAVAAVGSTGTAISWAACVSACDKASSTIDLIWAESSDGGATFPHLQSVANGDQRTNWSPSIVWAKADARHVLYEQSESEGYRLRIRTGAGAPK